MKLLYTA